MSKPMLIIRYAIRHKPTGHFLPHRDGGRGWSYDEPVECSEETQVLPRMLPTRQSANCALTAWLQGLFIPGWDDGSYVKEICPMPHRKREEMEIVTVQITLTNESLVHIQQQEQLKELD